MTRKKEKEAQNVKGEYDDISRLLTTFSLIQSFLLPLIFDFWFLLCPSDRSPTRVILPFISSLLSFNTRFLSLLPAVSVCLSVCRRNLC